MRVNKHKVGYNEMLNTILFNKEIIDLKKKEISIVDDNEDTLILLKTLLERENYVVKTFSSPGPLYKLENNFPELILLDVNLGLESGHELCSFLKKNPITKHIPVIMYSAKPIEGNSGADEHFNKPFNLSELKTSILRLVNRRTNITIN